MHSALPSYSEALAGPVVLQPAQPIAVAPLLEPSQGYSLGLDHLYGAEHIRFRQQLDMMEIFFPCTCLMPTEFELVDQNDLIIYTSKEQDHYCVRNWCPQGFRTDTTVSTTSGSAVLQFRRESRCVLNICLPFCCIPLPFSRERMTVSGSNGTPLGVVRHDWSFWKSRFSILDSTGSVIMKIEGPLLNMGCCKDLRYRIVSSFDGSTVGEIVKKYSGFMHEMCTDVDHFTLSVPRDLDVTCKAVLMGAVILINLLFFEGAFRLVLNKILCGGAYCQLCNN